MSFCIFQVMGMCFVSIINKVRHNTTRVNAMPNTDVFSISQITKLNLPLPQYRVSMHVDMSFKTRAFKTMLILFIMHVACWTPYAISTFYWNLNSKLAGNYTLGSVFLALGYSNCACNPVIYYVRINKFRKACKDLVPQSLRSCSHLSEQAKRRINPSVLYEANEVSITS